MLLEPNIAMIWDNVTNNVDNSNQYPNLPVLSIIYPPKGPSNDTMIPGILNTFDTVE